MTRLVRAVGAALVLQVTSPAHADVLIDNVVGLTPSEDGTIETFEAVLIGDDGKVERVYDKRPKKPGKVDYRLDAKGQVMIPGLIDSHVQVMELGFALLKAKVGLLETPYGKPRPEDRDVAFSMAQEALLKTGVTTVADMGTTIEDWQTYRRAGDTGALRIRIVAYAGSANDMSLIGGSGPSVWVYEDRLKQNGLFIPYDGPLKRHEAWLKAPYADDPKLNGSPRISSIQLRNLLSRGAIDNFQVAVAANGDAAASAALDAIEEMALTYKGDRRWRIETLSVVDPSDVARMGQNGMVASVQPGEHRSYAATGPALLGPERLVNLDRWRSLADGGAELALGTGPGEKLPQPFVTLAEAVSRRQSAAIADPGMPSPEALGRDQALKAYTTGAAHALFAEGKLGRIAKGYRADFLFIDRNPLTVPAQELAGTRISEVWIGGQLVWKPGMAEAEKPSGSR